MIIEGRTDAAYKSHLAWGAWIEMNLSWKIKEPDLSRTSHGVRGLK